MGFHADAQAAGLDPKHITAALSQLGGSALAIQLAIEEDVLTVALIAEVDRLRTLVGVVTSAFSVLVLSQIVQPRAPDEHRPES